jgi:hypothetical protein
VSDDAAYSAFVLMHLMKDRTYVIEHVMRGRWSALDREKNGTWTTSWAVIWSSTPTQTT